MWPHSIPKPQDQLRDLMMGKLEWNDAPEAIRSWARLGIHQAAKQICAASDKGTRRNMLGRVPAHMRAMVEEEVKRLWNMRTE